MSELPPKRTSCVCPHGWLCGLTAPLAWPCGRYCDVTTDIPNDYVEFDDVNNTPGFRALFEVYVEAQGWEAPDQHPAEMYERVLRCKFIRRRVMKISGIHFLDFSGGERAKLGCKWYAMELFTVFIDLLFLFLLPIIIIERAMGMQYMYAFSTAPTPAVTFFDVMGEFPPNFDGVWCRGWRARWRRLYVMAGTRPESWLFACFVRVGGLRCREARDADGGDYCLRHVCLHGHRDTSVGVPARVLAACRLIG